MSRGVAAPPVRLAVLVAALTGLVASLAAEALSVASSKKPRTELISRRSNAGPGGNASSYPGIVSGSGGFVAFTSEATNLGGSPGADTNAYLYDRGRKRLTFIARRGKRKANGESVVGGISANGRYVAFSTDASNLGGPTRADVNVYLFDRLRDRITLVSRRSGKRGKGANGDSFDASLSANGRYVAFASEATNLGGSLNATRNVYVYDRKARRVSLVSRASGKRGAGGDDVSGRPAISGDGRRVAFETEADNLGGPAQDVTNVYLRDRERKRTHLVSRSGPDGGDDDSENASISAGGRFVGFRTFAQNLGGPIQTDANIYLYDRKRRRLQLISRQGNGGPGADAVSYHSAISASGRYVAFDTEATNLGGPINSDLSVYLYDRKRKRLELISRRSGREGTGADGRSANPSISTTGRFVGFDSAASNLSPAAAGPPYASMYLRDRGR